jgi:hypothetical protein
LEDGQLDTSFGPSIQSINEIIRTISVDSSQVSASRWGSPLPLSPLIDMGAALCGPGNKATFGSCIASAGVGLELHIDAAEPVHPDLSFPVLVRKVDYYNQTVASDSASYLQIRSGTATNSSGDRKVSGLAAVLSGTTVFVLQGGTASVKVALRPYMGTVDVASGSTQIAGDTLIYVDGIDNETSLQLR